MRDSPFGQLRHEPRVLLGPGPSNLHPRVAQAMTSPVLGYLDPEFLAIMDRNSTAFDKARNSFCLANDCPP